MKKKESFKSLIQAAGLALMEQEAEAYPAEEELDVTISPRLEEKMQKLIQKEKKKRSLRRINAFVRTAAACIAVVSVSLTCFFAVSPLFQDAALRKLSQWVDWPDSRFKMQPNYNSYDLFFDFADGVYRSEVQAKNSDSGVRVYCSGMSPEGGSFVVTVYGTTEEPGSITTKGEDLTITPQVITHAGQTVIIPNRVYETSPNCYIVVTPTDGTELTWAEGHWSPDSAEEPFS